MVSVNTAGGYRSEFIIALTCAVGTDSLTVRDVITEELKKYNYQCVPIKISKALLEPLEPQINTYNSFKRTNVLMDLGNTLRRDSHDNAILAKGAIHQIQNFRKGDNQHSNDGTEPIQSTVYIIDSLKHPDEVKILREVYTDGFYLFAINEDEDSRLQNLIDGKNIGKEDAQKLIDRDIDEAPSFGQKTSRVFELADFHLSLNGWRNINKSIDTNSNNIKKKKCVTQARTLVIAGQIKRVIELMFGNPFITPTFDEYAMFMAYSSGLRSADLSRQVGAVIALPNNEIVAMGANDCPKYGGGQYWQHYDTNTHQYVDDPNGRDYMIGYDSNKEEFFAIVDEIVSIFDYKNDENGVKERAEARRRILNSRLKYLTEYGRPVHAEMAAILSCARTGISLQGATLYCTTFPCHNCAKHIISAGISRVVYIEPYPKSKSVELYPESIGLSSVFIEGSNDGDRCGKNMVQFQEFVGIGPRRFYDLFSMQLSSGYPLIRKGKDGRVIDWTCKNAELRCIMAPTSYFERETAMITNYLAYLDTQQNV